MERKAYLVYQALWKILDWLFPPICGGCGQRYTRWCAKCHNSIRQIEPPFCERCGNPLEEAGMCRNCREIEPHFTAMRSWATYEGALREALQRMKYQRDIGLGEIFAKPLIAILVRSGWQIDVVMPVPLGVARHKERGYNQSALIAFPMALYFGCSYQPRALRRIRETRSQVGLNLVERRANVTDAFIAKPDWVSNKNVLIVDDIATSGATMDSCAAALKAAGAQDVYGLTVARAILGQSYDV